MRRFRRQILQSFCVIAGLCAALGSVQGATVTLTSTGTLGAVQSGTDPLNLSGKTYTLTSTVDSNATPTATTANSASYTAQVTVKAGNLPQSNCTATATITNNATGNDTIGITNCNALLARFSAVVSLPAGAITSTTPAGFPSTTIDSASSTATYTPVLGGNPTTLFISGTAVATGPASPVLTGTPPSLTFAATQGGSSPAAQIVSLSSSGAVVNFTASASTTSGGNWLSVSPTSGNTPGTITVTAALGSLTAGTYSGSITVNGPKASNTPLTIPVTFTVTGLPALILSPAALSFSAQQFGGPPANKQINVTSSGAALSYTASASTQSGGGWLSVTPSGTTPGVLTVSVNPAGLAPATYQGTITVSSAGASNSPQTASVTLNITAAPSLVLSPTSLTFGFQQGGSAPPAQNVSVTSTGSVLSFSASASTTSGGNWLSVSPGSGNTPGTVSVSVSPGSLAAGSYSGTVTITSAQAGNSPRTVPVTFNVTSAPSLSTSPGSLGFSYQVNGTQPASQTLAVSASGGANLSFTAGASTTSGGNWLSVAPTSGTTPANLTVSVNTAGLAPGVYSGAVTITSGQASNSPLRVPVTLTVTSAPALTVSPSSLSFSFQIGGATPASKTVALGSSGFPLSFTAAASTTGGGNWLSVTPANGTTPATLTANVNPAGLSPGAYNGAITITSAQASNSPVTVPVTFTVTAAPNLTATPASLSFAFQQGGTPPGSRTIAVGSSGSALTFTAAASTMNGGNWLSVTPSGGTTPANLTVSVNPAGLTPAVYNGTITISSAGAGNSPLTVSVTFTVTAAPTISATPGSLSFGFQIGGTPPGSQPVAVSSSGNPLNFTAAATTTSGGNWLSVAPANGTTPSTVTVSVNPTGLAAGTYSGTVTVTSPASANGSASVSVTLTVSSAPLLTTSPSAMSFNAQVNGSAAPQNLSVASSGTALTFTAAASTTSGGNWLSVAPTGGTTPANLTVSVSTAGLAAGTYGGAITLTSAGASNSPLSVPVTLTITALPTLSVGPASLAFSMQASGSNPASQPLSVASSGPVINFTAAASTTSGGNWLGVTPASGSTPAALSVSVNGAGLAVGTYNGAIVITSAGAANSPVNVPVTLTVTAAPTLSTSPASMAFASQIGAGNPAAQSLSVASSGAAINFTAAASTTSGGNWLSVAPISGSTPGSLTVSVNATSLAAGTYSGAITITSPQASNSPLTVPVTLTVSSAPVLSASPASLAFSAQTGNNPPAPQNISVTSSGAPISFTAAAATTSGGNWLSVSPSSGATPASLSVSVNPAGLAAGSYGGTITITPAAGSAVTVAVTLTVTSTAALSASPTSLAFSFQTGGGAPAPQTVSVTSNGGPIDFTAAASTTSGGNWLAVAPASGTTPATLNVSVNATGLAAATYTGTISINSATGGSASVAVTLTVTPAGALSASPTSLNFTFQTGGTVPSAQNVAVISNAGPLAFTAAAATTSGGNWLAVSPASGTTPATLSVSVNPAGLAGGSYSGTISITSGNAGSASVSVTLTVTQQPSLSASPAALSFSYNGSIQPTAQTLSITGGALAFTAAASTSSGGNWLTVTPPGGTMPATLNVSVHPSGLASGEYSGAIVVTASGASNSPLTIPVTLTVTLPSITFVTSANAVSFTIPAGGAAPPPQSVSVSTSDNAQHPYTVGADVFASTWLQVFPLSGTTPGQFTVQISPRGIPTGTYQSFIYLMAPGVASAAIPVTLRVTPGTSISVSPVSLMFAAQPGGGAPPPQTLSVTSTGDPLNFSAQVFGGSWLTASPISGAAPGSIVVSVNPAGLVAGTYTGSIAVSGTSANGFIGAMTIPVTLTVSSGGGAATLAASPNTLQFNAPSASAVLPPQAISVTSMDGPVGFAATAAGGSWFSVNVASGTTPAVLQVTATAAGLAPGTYNGSITISSAGASNSPLVIPVALTIGGTSGLTVAPGMLTFTFQRGGAVPGSQTVQVASTGSTAFNAASGGGDWLTVNPASATAPATLTVSIDPDGLVDGSYMGSILITPAGGGGGFISVPVALTITAPAPPGGTQPVILGIVNAASGLMTYAPGTTVAIFGTNLGPAQAVTLAMSPDGSVSDSLGGTRVLFNGMPAPLLFVSQQQINSIVPYGLTGSISVQVEYNGIASLPFTVTLTPEAPSLFTLTATGTGQGAILNQDLSVNGFSNPAAGGSIVVLYGTGGGETNPPSQTGGITSSPGALQAPVSVTIGGQPAEVLYAGPAPGLVAGVIQINVKSPTGLGAGPVPVVVQIGDFSSQAGVTMAIK